MNKSLAPPILIKDLGLVEYQTTWSKMKSFTEQRDKNTPDEIWVLEHNPVFTLGQAGKMEHLLATTDIPIIQCDRGGQITYHGPGQIVIYLLIDLRRLKITIRPLVSAIEQSIIKTLEYFNINSFSDKNAPGVYVNIDNNKSKICSLGLRVKKGCAYHGLALNYNMDLKPFKLINPCGFKNLEITQVTELNNKVAKQELINTLCNKLKLLLDL